LILFSSLTFNMAVLQLAQLFRAHSWRYSPACSAPKLHVRFTLSSALASIAFAVALYRLLINQLLLIRLIYQDISVLCYFLHNRPLEPIHASSVLTIPVQTASRTQSQFPNRCASQSPGQIHTGRQEFLQSMPPLRLPCLHHHSAPIATLRRTHWPL